jgi:hypothetical protein
MARVARGHAKTVRLGSCRHGHPTAGCCRILECSPQIGLVASECLATEEPLSSHCVSAAADDGGDLVSGWSTGSRLLLSSRNRFLINFGEHLLNTVPVKRS